MIPSISTYPKKEIKKYKICHLQGFYLALLQLQGPTQMSPRTRYSYATHTMMMMMQADNPPRNLSQLASTERGGGGIMQCMHPSGLHMQVPDHMAETAPIIYEYEASKGAVEKGAASEQKGYVCFNWGGGGKGRDIVRR